MHNNKNFITCHLIFLYRYIFLYVWLELLYTEAMTWRINILIQTFIVLGIKKQCLQGPGVFSIETKCQNLVV